MTSRQIVALAKIVSIKESIWLNIQIHTPRALFSNDRRHSSSIRINSVELGVILHLLHLDFAVLVNKHDVIGINE